jgi:hypothetical protein
LAVLGLLDLVELLTWRGAPGRLAAASHSGSAVYFLGFCLGLGFDLYFIFYLLPISRAI